MDPHEEVVLSAIFARRSIRSYVEGKTVEREKIQRLLEAAMAAPSACNIQPWEFIVIDDPAMIARIKSSIKLWSKYNAPLLMVVCSYTQFIPWDGDRGLIDCSAAVENMLIAAAAMGLGSVWIGGFDPKALHELLDIPDDVMPAAVVYFGYPAEEKEPRTRYLEEAVYWNRYDPERAHPPRPGNILTGGRD